MAFESFAAFLVMEGHGPYVWTCYGVFFVLMGVLMLLSLRQRRAVMNACRRRHESGQERPASATQPAASFARVEVSQD